MRAAEQSALALLDEANLTHGFSLAY